MNAAEDYARSTRDDLQREARRDSPVLTGSAPTVIRMDDVWLAFDEPVLRGIHLQAVKGETLLIVGESGSGKSTILKLILRLLVPDRGSIQVFGRDIVGLSFDEALDLRRRMGTVFQTAALFDSLTVFENVAYPLRENTDLGEAAIDDVVRERLRFVDMDPDAVADRLPAELSGGMRKRVGIARAVATEPEIVLYDEPTAGLDPLKVETITNLIRKLQAELGVTSVVVTHDLRAGFRVADRVSLLHDGVIGFEGTPEEMMAVDDPYIRKFLS